MENRNKNRDVDAALVDLCYAHAANMTMAEATARLEAERVPFAMVLSPDELTRDPHAVAVGLFTEREHHVVRTHALPRHPIQFRGTPADTATRRRASASTPMRSSPSSAWPTVSRSFGAPGSWPRWRSICSRGVLRPRPASRSVPLAPRQRSLPFPSRAVRPRLLGADALWRRPGDRAQRRHLFLVADDDHRGRPRWRRASDDDQLRPTGPHGSAATPQLALYASGRYVVAGPYRGTGGADRRRRWPSGVNVTLSPTSPVRCRRS